MRRLPKVTGFSELIEGREIIIMQNVTSTVFRAYLLRRGAAAAEDVVSREKIKLSEANLHKTTESLVLIAQTTFICSRLAWCIYVITNQTL